MNTTRDYIKKKNTKTMDNTGFTFKRYLRAIIYRKKFSFSFGFIVVLPII